MTRLGRMTATWVCAAVLTLAAGCAHKGGGMFPTRLDLRIVASASLNPDVSGRASPVVMRLYDLVDKTAFENADFFSLYDNETAVLGKDMLAREELELKPGDRRTVERKADPEARYLGVMVAFRDVDNATWRAVAALKTNASNQLNIALGGEAVTLSRR